MSWTVIDSPVGELRLVEHDGALTAIEFSPFRDSDGRPRGERDDTQPLLAERMWLALMSRPTARWPSGAE